MRCSTIVGIDTHSKKNAVCAVLRLEERLAEVEAEIMRILVEVASCYSKQFKAVKSVRSESLRRVAEASHDLQRQRCVPALVLPFLSMSAPQEGHLILFTAFPPIGKIISVLLSY